MDMCICVCLYICMFISVMFMIKSRANKKNTYLVLCVLPLIHVFRCTCLSNPVGMKTLRKDQISERLKALWERLSGNDCSFL